MSLYLRHFGLQTPPFRNTPDTRFFYPGSLRGELLEGLVYAIDSGEAIVKVVGEVGTGKTTLSRMLAKRLPGHIDMAYILNPGLGPLEIRAQIAGELGVRNATGQPPTIADLQLVLLDRYGRGRQVLVIIDEAQAMSLEALEEIRLLSNLETETSKLLQILLLGQPELEERLQDPRIRQLRERIAHSFELKPLAPDDVHAYIRRRLIAAGATDQELFTPEALEVIARASGGISRRVNILADRALLAAFSDAADRVGIAHAKRACALQPGEGGSPLVARLVRWRPPAAALGAVAGAIAVLAGLAVLALTGALRVGPDSPGFADGVDVAALEQPHPVAPVEAPISETPTAPPSSPGAEAAEPMPRGVTMTAGTSEPDDTAARSAWPAMWQTDEPGAIWTIQLAALPGETAAQRHVGALTTLLDREQLFSAPIGANSQLHGIWYGRFDSRTAAEEAIAALPARLQRDQPFPRRPAVFMAAN